MRTRKISHALAATIAVLLASACSSPQAPVVVAPQASAAPAPSVKPAPKVQIQWLGQSATKITTPGGKVIVIDPWLVANPMTPPQYKNLDALGKVDLILVTHAHGDHSADAPALAKLNKAIVYGPAGMNQSMTTLGVLPNDLSIRFGKGGTITPFPGIRITATRAEHSSELAWKNPASGKEEVHVGGEPVGFIIELENGFKIYHMGDTGIFGDMKLIGDYYKPDLIMIPIGGHYVMDPQDAAMVTREFLKPKYAIPMHYGTNPFLKGTPAEYEKAMGNTPTRIYSLKAGETLQF